MSLSGVRSKLKALKSEDDRLSEVIDQILRIVKELEETQKVADDALTQAKWAASKG